MTRGSLGRRLVLAVAAAVALVAAATAGIGWWQMRAVYRGHLERMLSTMVPGAAAAASAAATAGSADPDAAARADDVRRVVASPWKGTGVEFRVARVARVAEGPAAAPPPLAESAAAGELLASAAVPLPAPGRETFFDVAIRNKRFRAVRAHVEARGGALDVFLAHPRNYEERRLREIGLGLALAWIAVAAGGALAARAIVRRTLRPVAAAAAALDARGAETRDARDARDTASRRAPPPVDPELQPLLDAAGRLVDEVERRARRGERFTADAAHELRTPLAVMLSTLQVADRDGAEPAELRAAIRETIDDLRGLDRLVEGLLLLARLQDGSRLEERERLRLDRLLAELTERMADSAPDAVVEAETGAPFEVEGDRALLERLFANLLENAIRHGPAGSPVRIELSVGSGACAVAVEDAGGALDAGDLESLFDPFRRGRPAGGRGRGTGLGLAIARAIARAHGGSLDLEVVPGRRTRAIVRLPAAGAPGAAGEAGAGSAGTEPPTIP